MTSRTSDQLLVLTGPQIEQILTGREHEVIDAVSAAYVAHEHGKSSLPHSSFLRFPDNDTDRIICLPAYLGDGFEVAGMKWIASFPGNVGKGMARASAVLVLNSMETGRPEAILESSIISARRTAASAALAARELVGEPPRSAGLVGTGVINLEVARFLAAALPSIGTFTVFDLDRERAEDFVDRLARVLPQASGVVVDSAEELLAGHTLVSYATTAIRPHQDSLEMCPPGAVVLHVSLRDLTPEVILASDNVVDDLDHVARAQTSIHLAEQVRGDRGFVRATIAQVVEGTAPPKADPDAVTVVSPFGLGVLDLALGKLAYDAARAKGVGTVIPSFLPTV